MIKQISHDKIFVKGYNRSAIYCFDTGKVYSIDEKGTEILCSYLEGNNIINNGINEIPFISQIKKVLNIPSIENSDFFPELVIEKNLEQVWLELTQRCGNKCIHCYEGELHKEVEYPITFDKWKDVIYQLSEIKCKRIQFIGGEPSLYKNLPDLIEYASQVGIENISIFSNLYSISDRLLESIINNKVSVHFSIYGATPSQHDSITQIDGSFQKLINNLELLLKNKVNVNAHVVIMKENEPYIEQIYSILAKFNIVNVRYDEIREVYGECQNNHLVSTSKLLMKRPNFRITKQKFLRAFYHNTCWYGKFVVSTDGNVHPCEFEHNITYGSVLEKSIVEILNSKIVDKYWNFDFSKVEFCKNCEYRFACQDCRPLAFGKRGNFTDKIPRCLYNPYNGEWG